jgi:hypothetical protein
MNERSVLSIHLSMPAQAHIQALVDVAGRDYPDAGRVEVASQFFDSYCSWLTVDQAFPETKGPGKGSISDHAQYSSYNP